MKTWFLIACLFVGGGEHEKGLALYRDGKFAEAAAAFRAAIEAGDDSAEIQYDLALASWRAAQVAPDDDDRKQALAAAETAVEKYAALAKNARPDLHRGLLGVVRHDEAKAIEARANAIAAAPPVPPTAAPGAAPSPAAAPADPLPLLEDALAKANQAKDHFLAGAARGTTPELLRNTERTLRYIDELQKKIDELKKQREQQKKDDEQKKDDKKDEKKDDKKDGDQKSDDKKDGDQKPDEQKDGDKKPDDKKPDDKKDGKGEPKDDASRQDGEQKPEPKPDAGKDGKDGKEQEPKPGEPQKPESGQPETKPGQPRNDAPGESAEAKELSPEQTQRMLEQLKDLDQKLKAIRARAKTSRPPVERDW